MRFPGPTHLLDRVTAEGAWDNTYVLLTSDHGGTRKGHGENSLAEIQIPWMLAGPEIVPGPIAASVNTYDTAATLAWIFQLEPPQCWTGRPVLAAFQPAFVSARLEAARPRQGCAPTIVTTDSDVSQAAPRNPRHAAPGVTLARRTQK